MKGSVVVCLGLVVCLLLLAPPTPARATNITVTFNGLAYPGSLSGLYDGLDWSHWDTAGSFYQSYYKDPPFPNGDTVTLVSGWNSTVSVPSGTFNVVSAYFSSAVFDAFGGFLPGISASQLTITGTRNGNTVAAQVIALTGNWSSATLNMDGIDTLTLVGSDPSGGNGFMIDYFTYNTNPVPLPSAVLLLGPGIAGLAAIRRRFTK